MRLVGSVGFVGQAARSCEYHVDLDALELGSHMALRAFRRLHSCGGFEHTRGRLSGTFGRALGDAVLILVKGGGRDMFEGSDEPLSTVRDIHTCAGG